ncbi:hypothetical protein NtB2_01483 [Lactococcus termiticola]|uniref:Uncharacterized protein n=1 Tax=Lactococcus termiticola TaxID=2169526 RepID=A0A2R5HH59_9LACT|nr:hypothetical protein NtB2_01483 [Lactococcus termiticola]
MLKVKDFTENLIFVFFGESLEKSRSMVVGEVSEGSGFRR